MLGGGGGGILAALPTPLGSLTELLRPPALPGPRGIPLTPASCARDGIGASKQPANTKAKNDDLPNMIYPSPNYPTKSAACRSSSGGVWPLIAVDFSGPWRMWSRHGGNQHFPPRRAPAKSLISKRRK